MTAVCPQCGAPDQCVAVPQALMDVRLDGGVRAVLAPPPEPLSARPRMNTASTALFAIAGVLCLLGFVSRLNSSQNLDRYSAAYRLGYHLGPILLPAFLAAIGLVVHLVTRKRRDQAAERDVLAQRALWQRHTGVWQAGWLCRRCWIAFFPAASVHPDLPASPAIPLVQFPQWVMAGAEPAAVPGRWQG